jgi:hypothetical protein
VIPISVKAVRCFVGMRNNFWDFISNLYGIYDPSIRADQETLTEEMFVIKQATVAAFENLKDMIVEQRMLMTSDNDSDNE